MITTDQENKLQQQFKGLGSLETLLLGHYSGKSGELITKVSTGYAPGFEIAAFAHAGDEAAISGLIAEAKKTTWPLSI